MTPAEDDDPEVAWLAESLGNAVEEIRRGRWMAEVLARAIDRQAEAAVAATAGAEAAAGWRPPEGSFDYITIAIPAFLRLMHQLDAALASDDDYRCQGVRYRPVRFLEVGCGPGRIIALMRLGSPLLWSELLGFDIAAPLVEAGRAAFDLGDSLQVADAMTFDYSAHDVVFSYRPFMDDGMQQAYEAHVQRSMRVGAYLVAPLAMDRSPSHRMMPIDEGAEIWKKIG